MASRFLCRGGGEQVGLVLPGSGLCPIRIGDVQDAGECLPGRSGESPCDSICRARLSIQVCRQRSSGSHFGHCQGLPLLEQTADEELFQGSRVEGVDGFSEVLLELVFQGFQPRPAFRSVVGQEKGEIYPPAFELRLQDDILRKGDVFLFHRLIDTGLPDADEPHQERGAGRVDAKPLLQARHEFAAHHGFQLAGWTWEGDDDLCTRVEEETRGGAVGVGKEIAPSGDQALTALIGGNLSPGFPEALFHGLERLFVFFQRYARELFQSLAGDVIVRRAEPTGDDDDPRLRAEESKGFDDVLAPVVHGDGCDAMQSEGAKCLGEKMGVGIRVDAVQQFSARDDDRVVHGLSGGIVLRTCCRHLGDHAKRGQEKANAGDLQAGRNFAHGNRRTSGERCAWSTPGLLNDAGRELFPDLGSVVCFAREMDTLDSGSPLARRKFFGAAFGGALMGPAGNLVAGESPVPVGQFREPARDIPLRGDDEVIVCGGGPAGVAAAITAARAGARTRIFEVHGCLGGVWTAGLLTYIFDFNKPGLTRELVRKLDERDARRSKNPDRFTYEPDEMKLLLEELCQAAGVRTQLHTRVAAAYRDGNRLSTIATESKSGREAWRAPVFIDATGDGDLGALAGCGWDVGQGLDCPCQPMTLNAVAVVRDVEALGEFISFFKDDKRHLSAVEAFKREIARAGLEASYGHPTLFHIHGNLVLVMINHEYGVKAYDAAGITEATLRARAEIFRIVRGLRGVGGPWEGIQVAATAEQIGVRDGRRIHGRYTVNREDLISGARHSDAVARATFGVDIHAATRQENRTETISHGNFKTKPYDIPLRALLAKDVDGLLMAGRCISGDFLAHASYRVTGNAVAMGEAAGAVAALAAKSKRLPHEVDWNEAAEWLRSSGQRVG